MTIDTIYHVSVEIPEEVWELHGLSTRYAHLVSAAIEGFIEAGADTYGPVYEWASFNTMEEAQRCERMLKELPKQLEEPQK